MSLRSFIVRDEQERAWMLDMHRRLMPRVAAAIAVCGLGLLPWMTPAAFALLGAIGVAWLVAGRVVERTGRLEAVVAAWALTQPLLAAIIVLCDAVLGGGFALLALSIVGASGGFPTRLVWAGTAYVAAIMAAVALATVPAAVADDPPRLVTPVLAMFGIALLGTAVRRSSMEHRSAAIVDPLTGLLNRAALVARARELEHRSSETLEPVAVAVLDLDHFKMVNDAHGHAAGDRVLVEVADRLKRRVRASDVVYRMGGEEFVVLLPGADEAEASAIAARLCAAVRQAAPAGIAVTASIGVAASAADGAFAFDTVFAAADAALYSAKEAGRDRVVPAAVAA